MDIPSFTISAIENSRIQSGVERAKYIGKRAMGGCGSRTFLPGEVISMI